MPDLREEWFKLVLEELRKNNDKVDQIRLANFDQVRDLEKYIEQRLDKSEIQHRELMTSQVKMQEEHRRMNDLLAEHMRRTEANEKIIEIHRIRLEKVEEEIEPAVEAHRLAEAEKNAAAKNLKRNAVIVGMISGLLGIVATILKILEII